MGLSWICGDHPPEFEDRETVGLLAGEIGMREELIETYLGRRSVKVIHNGRPLDYRSVGDLRYLTGVCRHPPAWMTRATLDENYRWIFTCRSIRYDHKRVRNALSAVSLAAWREPPRLEDRVDTLRPLIIRALSLARLLFFPHRVLVLDSPFAGVAGGERSLLLDTLHVLAESPGLKLIVAERRNELPPFCDRMFSVERDAAGFRFEEEAQ